MAYSCDISLSAPSFPMKIVPYVPQASKPKLKSRAKSTATTKTAEQNRSEVSSSGDDGEWFYIDDFPMPDSNAPRSLDPGVLALLGAANASGPLGHDVVGRLSAVSESEKLEHYQSGGESLTGGGTDHAISVAKTNSALNGSSDGSSLESPLIIESDSAEEHHSTTQVKHSSGALGAEGYLAEQDGDIDTATVRALSVEGVEGIRHEPSPAEGEPLFDVDMINRSSLTRKRTHCSPNETVISIEMSDITSEPGLEDPRLAKRRRSSERQAESLILNHMPTPKRTPLPTASSPNFHSSVSNEPISSLLDSDNQYSGAGNPVSSQNNLEEENGDDGTHVEGIVEELSHSPKQLLSLEEIEGDIYINPDSDRRVEKSNASDGEIRKSHEDEPIQVDDASYKASMTTSQRRKPSNRPVQKKERNPSQISLRPRDQSTMPTTTSRQVSSSQSQHPPTSRTERVTWSRSPQNSYSGIKDGDELNINESPSDNIAYQITDISLYPVPQSSSVVTAIIRYSESKLPSNLMALYPNILGKRGQVIRITQVSPDSWLLLGYRYGDIACTRGSSMLRNADQMSSFCSDAAGHDSDYPEDDGDEDEENGEEGTGEYGPHAAGSDSGSGRDDARFRQRTHKPWKESDEQRLLSYKDKMAMGWDQVVSHFPDRSAGAVKLRYYTLRKKCS